MKRSAFTLLEILIALGILVVVGSLISLLLVRTMRATTRGTLRVEMQQQAVIAMQRILTDLHKSCCAGVTVRSGAAPRALCICPISQPDLRAGEPPPVQGDGQLVWSKFFLIYDYDSAAQQIRYREWPPGSVAATSLETDPGNPRRLTSGRLAQVLAGTGTHLQVVCSGVTSFQLSYPPGGSDDQYVQPLTLEIVQQRRGNTGHSQPETFSYRRSVFLAEQR